jgi:glycosyltransferase involved in cell wall biosynthesis
VRSASHEACYRQAFQLLEGVPVGRVRLLARDPDLARELQALAGGRLAIGVAPHMKALPSSAAPPAARGAGQAPLVGFLGGSRPERGVTLVPAIVEAFRARHGLAARFLVQLDPSAGDQLERFSPGFRAAAERLAATSGVTVVPGRLSSEAYAAQLVALDVVLLLHLSLAKGQGSGVLYEAIALGKAVVLPADSHLAREAAALDAGALTFPEASAETVADVLGQAVRQLPELAARAWAAAGRFRAGRDLAAFFDALVSEGPSR